MESLKDTFDKKIETLKRKSEAQKGKEYRYLWVRVNFATAKDEHIKRIGARAFGIFMVIRTFMGKDETAYPSLARIAYLSGCGISTVQKEIEGLIEHGWIVKVGRIKVGSGKFGNTAYRILEKDLIRGSKQRGFIDDPLVQFTDGKQDQPLV